MASEARKSPTTREKNMLWRKAVKKISLDSAKSRMAVSDQASGAASPTPADGSRAKVNKLIEALRVVPNMFASSSDDLDEYHHQPQQVLEAKTFFLVVEILFFQNTYTLRRQDLFIFADVRASIT